MSKATDWAHSHVANLVYFLRADLAAPVFSNSSVFGQHTASGQVVEHSVSACASCSASFCRIGMRECKIIAKIENMEGLVNYKEIMDECDVMLLSRGSMGNCVDPEKMFLAQKMLLRVRQGAAVAAVATVAVGRCKVQRLYAMARKPCQACQYRSRSCMICHGMAGLIKTFCPELTRGVRVLQECNLSGKPIYVTRVVDTMTDAPRPTRAEATGRPQSSNRT